ncbi:MAG: DNA recombination protein RmuC [Candidatus Shapirobacteria bacterium]|nr:DNA recombination protein RmuC [Candidatus Shapirobacteria bacterium]MDD5073652.1 DNA recombination protein RmuC [Candidatus Shapirobacteria bacterium]MDD5481387.1 DNA recombination protein RmuC [Candidatus Shapirobacteria bacterium]
MMLYFLIGSLFLVMAVLGYFLVQKLNRLESVGKQDDSLTEWLKSMQQSLDKTNESLNQAMRESNKTVADSLQKSTQSMNERLDKAAEFIAGVKKEVGQMAEIGRGMKDIQEFLRSPKLRGNIGEMILKELLGQMLPKKTFNLQYSFKSGETVDAAIQTEAGLVPIDSKFPMENFRKMIAAETDKDRDSVRKIFINDVRKHIRTIAAKYILPDEGTIDYALMYIPSEAVYYEIVNDPDLFDYAGKNKVLPVSPTTFYAYMKAILASFEGQKVEERAKQILAALGAIGKDYEKIADNLSTLSRHLTNAHNQMNNVNASFNLLGQKIVGAKQLESGIEASDGKALGEGK